jgi:hypothetical protein
LINIIIIIMSNAPVTNAGTLFSSLICPTAVVSRQSLARLLVGITTLTVCINVLLLFPPLQSIPLHENPYFFTRDNHVLDKPQRSSLVLLGTTSGTGPRHHTPHSGRNQTATTGPTIQATSTATTLKSSSLASSLHTKTIDYASFTDEQGQQYIEDTFQEAGILLTDEMRLELPTWRQIQDVVGTHPYIVGLESMCTKFQRKVPPLERMMGASGMFNTGTNLVTHLLKQNCEIPERRAKMGPKQSKESYGMRWQVPVST